MSEIYKGDFEDIFRSASLRPGQFTIVAEISPAIAWRLFDSRNTNNFRDLNQGEALAYADLMKKGLWKLNHQGIAFDPDGILLDGQKRLFAVHKACIPIQFNVSFNVEEASNLTIDVHSQRTKGQALKHQFGAHITPLHAAVFNRVHFGFRATFPKTSLVEVNALYDRYSDSIDWAISLFKKAPNGVRQASVVAAFARAYYTEPRHQLDLAASKLANRAGIFEEGDQSLSTLWKWLVSKNYTYSGSGQYEVYGKTCRAIQAWLKGEKLIKLYMPQEEIFHIQKSLIAS